LIKEDVQAEVAEQTATKATTEEAVAAEKPKPKEP